MKVTSKYKIELEEEDKLNSSNPRLYGTISAEDTSEILWDKNVSPYELEGAYHYACGTVEFEFNKELTKCIKATLSPTYYDKVEDEYYSLGYIYVDVSDIFKIE